jgi:S-adenosylmethionine/arginine decarboxylase-like enzyme
MCRENLNKVLPNGNELRETLREASQVRGLTQNQINLLNQLFREIALRNGLNVQRNRNTVVPRGVSLMGQVMINSVYSGRPLRAQNNQNMTEILQRAIAQVERR